MTAPPAPPRHAGRASEMLIADHAAMIADGRLAEGDRLPPERTLKQRFGVSRPVVREAIAQLAGRGLLTARPGYRPVIRKPGYETALGALGDYVAHTLRADAGVWHLFDSRIFIEAALARFAATHARRDDLAALREALAANEAAIGDAEAFYASDVAFDGLLFGLPGNPIYPVLHTGYVTWLAPHWRRMEASPDIDRLNHAGHAAIFDAIAARDPDGAETALRRHLTVAWEFIRATLRPGVVPRLPIR